MAEPRKEKEDKKPTKISSAKKRDLQNKRRAAGRRSFRSSVLTAVRGFEASLANKEAPAALKEKLNAVYSLMDKGVKKHVFNVNKAARTKSRLTARVTAAAV